VRANEGGTKLSKSDLLLSMITAKRQGIDAREEIYSFIDRLKSGLDHQQRPRQGIRHEELPCTGGPAGSLPCRERTGASR